MQVKSRLYYMDWLRVWAMTFVFLVHCAMPFSDVEDAWHIQFDQTNMAFSMFSGFPYQWVMHLFFFLAGTGTFLALGSRTPRQYLVERFQRLFVPFLFGSLAFTALQEYVSETSKYGSQGSFLQFYPRLYADCIVNSPGILRFDCFGSHLWFLGFLFLYSILTLPLIVWLSDSYKSGLINRMAAFSEKWGGILVFFLPTALIQAGLRARFPGHTDWSDFFLWLIYFALGYVFMSDRRFLDSVVRHRYFALGTGVVCLVIMSILLLNFGYVDVWEINPEFSTGYALYQVLRSFNSWLWVIAFVGLGIRHLDIGNGLVRYSREALLPFYIVHHVVLVLLAFMLIPWHPPLLVKFLTLLTSAFLITLGLYELLVRRFKWLRFLFGLRFTQDSREKEAG